MEATLFIKDTLDVTIRPDSLFHGENPIVLYNKCLGNPEYCVNEIWITLIICCTILLLGFFICYYNYKAKFRTNTKGTAASLNVEGKSKMEIKEGLYQELKLYRSQLANFMEKRTLKKETKLIDGKEHESIIRQYDEEKSKAYIDKLESILKELTTAVGKDGDSMTDETKRAETSSN